MTNDKKEIPTTELRDFYNILKMLSTNTRLNISKDFNRKENYINLCEIYRQSKKHFEKYINIENPFISNNDREILPKIPISNINKTNEIIAIFKKNGKSNIVQNGDNYTFEYIEKEISPIRTTDAIFDTGKPGKSSGQGGLDFIGWNKNDIPILGEIKIKDDKDPFFALIQLLTYSSELSTDNQIKRIKERKLFGNNRNFKLPFYLYIVLSDYNESNKKRNELLSNAKSIAEKIVPKVDDVKEVVFLKMDSPDGKLLKI